jgi:hypothetical protein
MRLGNGVRSADQHLCGGAAATATTTSTSTSTAGVERRYHPGLRGGCLRAHSRSVRTVGVRWHINRPAEFVEPMTGIEPASLEDRFGVTPGVCALAALANSAGRPRRSG